MNVMSRNARYLVTGMARVALALIAIALLGMALDIVLMPPRGFPTYLQLCGIALLAIGLYLEVRATYVLWMHGLGTPHPASPPSQLVDRGPYRFSRNPLYVARLLVLTGMGLSLSSIGILVMVFLLAVILEFVIIPREEGRLGARFGGAYREYHRRVPRWFRFRSRISSRNRLQL